MTSPQLQIWDLHPPGTDRGSPAGGTPESGMGQTAPREAGGGRAVGAQAGVWRRP